MHVFRYLTLVWPGLPWLWLRGSRSGLLLALAFAVTLDVAILVTFIWSELVGLEFTIALWTAAAAVWLVSSVSAAAAFPPPIPLVRGAAIDALFVEARDAYLARDWLAAETKLRALLVVRPTDGEAQLLLGTLLRRVGRRREARKALEALARSDAGIPWRSAIARELSRIAETASGDVDGAAEPASILPLAVGGQTALPTERAA